MLEKLEDDAVEKPKLREPSLVFSFPECSKLAPPVLPFDGVSFAYSGKKEDYLYEELNLAVDYDSRVALVGDMGRYGQIWGEQVEVTLGRYGKI